MFLDMFTKTNIKYEEDEYKIFALSHIDSYDCKYIEEKLDELLENISEMECKYLQSLYKGLTPNYDLKEEMFVYSPSDYTQKGAFDRVETADDLKLIYNRFMFFFENLFSYREKVIFVEMILLKRSRDVVRQILALGSKSVAQAKNSVLIKIGIGLNWENIKN